MATNTAVSGVRTVVRLAASLLLITVLVENTNDETAGLFFFATTLTGYFAGVDLAVGISVTKFVAEYRARGDNEGLNSLMRGSLLTMLALGGITAVLITGFAFLAPSLLFDEPIIKDQVTPTLLVVAVSALPYWVSRLGVAALNGLERYDLAAVIGIFSSVVLIGGFVVLVGLTDSAAVFTAFFMLVLVGEGLVAGIIAWKPLELRRRIGKWWGAHLRPAVGLGGAMFVIGLSDALLFSFDRAIVAASVGSAAIVIYEIALRPHNAARSISSLAGSALISTASRLLTQGRHERVRELVLTGSFINIVSTLPFVIIFMVLAEPLITLWVGDEYGRYAVYAQIFISYWLIGCNVGVLGSVVTGGGKMGVFAVIQLANAGAALALSIVLAGPWGVVGVIWGTVIPAWITAPLWIGVALRQLDISVPDYLRLVALPAYGITALWTAGLIAMSALLDTSEIPQLLLVCVAATVTYLLVTLPMVRRRWRSAMG